MNVNFSLLTAIFATITLLIHSLSAQEESLKKPFGISLIPDQSKVLGWITGAGDFSGQEVLIEIEGISTKATIREGNTFIWDYEVSKSTDVRISFGELSQLVKLYPISVNEPNVFFVLERSVYRPGQELKFAGFLRSVDKKGEFVPMANHSVVMKIVSEKKQTTATTLNLTSDEMGRVEGSYRWTEGDVIDQYTLSITDFKGTAKVSLAEYRKSKIKLKIDGKLKDGNIDVTFDAVDFLDKPVNGSKVTFTAEVIEGDEDRKKWSLEAKDYAYHLPTGPLLIQDKDDLTEDELLLLDSDVRLSHSISSGFRSVIAQFGSELPMDSGSARFPIEIKEEWLKQNCRIQVEGVLLDPNGHEQRATWSIPIGNKEHQTVLNLPKRFFATNETIPLEGFARRENGEKIKGKSTVVVMKLSSSLKPLERYPYDDRLRLYPASFEPIINVNTRQFNIRHKSWYPEPLFSEFSRTMVTALSMDNGKADIQISEPGAYKLVVVTHLPNGKSVRDEIGCVVRRPEEIPGLVLKMDKREYKNGETVSAEIQSRFADARVLMTLRDSSGFRLWKTYQLIGRKGQIQIPLPQDLSYACNLAIQYVGSDGKIHNADEIIRVVPEHRFITIKAQHKEQVSPGEKVKLDFELNRKEPVDLVVSVYDQSLLGVASEKQTDVRNFYFADERIISQRDRELLYRKLGHISLNQVVDRATQFLKELEKVKNVDNEKIINQFENTCNAIQYKRSLQMSDIVSLLKFVGVDCHYVGQLNTYAYMDANIWSESNALTLADLIDKVQTTDNKNLRYRFFNDVLAIGHDQVIYNHWGYGSQIWEGANSLNSRYTWHNHRSARGDAADSRMFLATANASFSAEGQAAISHMSMPIANMPLLINNAPGDGEATIRRDFSDAAFWNARVRTDANGKASVEFKLPDSLTNWHVVVTAVTKDLHVGTASSRFRTFKPVMIWPLLPRNFTLGDSVSIFGTVHNHTDKAQTIAATIDVNNGEIIDSPITVTVDVPAKGNVPVYWKYRPAKIGFTEILMSAKCADGNDASLKRLPVRDSAVWETLSQSGFSKGSVKFQVPNGIDLSTAQVDISIAPTLAADMADTLDYLVDYPHGCVEQTMSRFVPAIKVAQILKSYRIKNPSLEAKLPKCVDMGMKRLIELQHSDGGWGWNGNSTTHEMMTPYALYGLIEAENAGYKIPNDQALERAMNRLRIFIESMGESDTADRIYCMYVYSHRQKLQDSWWAFIEQQNKAGKLSDYATAMVLEMAVKSRKKSLADKLAIRLDKNAVSSAGTVYWTSAGFSRWGDDRNEITAAVLKALVAYDSKHHLIPRILAFFAQNKNGKRWNSTKDTAVILYAMCDYLATQDRSASGKASATIQVNQSKPATLELNDGLTATASFSGNELKSGTNLCQFLRASPSTMYRLNLKYRQVGNEIEPKSNGLKVTRQLVLVDEKTGQQIRHLQDGDSVPKGSYVMSLVTVNTEVADRLRYVLVQNPKPGSCEIQPVDDHRFVQTSSPYVLREDKEVGVFWHHEEVGNQIHDICILRCELAGEFVFAPAQVELMYQPEIRGHSGTIKLRVE